MITGATGPSRDEVPDSNSRAATLDSNSGAATARSTSKNLDADDSPGGVPIQGKICAIGEFENLGFDPAP